MTISEQLEKILLRTSASRPKNSALDLRQDVLALGFAGPHDPGNGRGGRVRRPLRSGRVTRWLAQKIVELLAKGRRISVTIYAASTDSEPLVQNRPFTIEVAERVKAPALPVRTDQQLMYEKRRAGDDVIDLGMGNPTDPPQDLVIEKLAEAARDPKNHGYSRPGHPRACGAKWPRKYLKQYGVRLDPESRSDRLPGIERGLQPYVSGPGGAGRHGHRAGPLLPAHVYAVAMAAANAIPLEVADSEKLLSNIDYTCRHLRPRPKLLIVNYPHNPSTVTSSSPSSTSRSCKLAKRYGFMVISDLAYADVAFDGYQPPSFLAAPGRDRRGRRVHHHEQGLQHGRLAGRLLLRATPRWCGPWRRSRATTITACSGPSRSPPSWPCGTPTRRSRPRPASISAAATCCATGWTASAGRWHAPRAGMFVWAKMPEPGPRRWTSFDFAMKLLEEADVAVSPGSGFGPAGEGYFRMALVENEKRLRQAVRQIGRCLGK